MQFIYIIAAALFVLSLKWMNSPETARRGVFAGEIGMLLAIVGTLLRHEVVDYKLDPRGACSSALPSASRSPT